MAEGARIMYLAWNTQKNKMSDVKGKEYEQEREGEIKNNEIDSARTHLNYDLIQSDKNLYQRVKKRVDELKQSGSRVQKNSVVTYSNILTVPASEAEEWGEEKTADYFKACTEYFQERFGEENVVSAKVHLDETAPHMHLHFLPVSKETGKLQARSVMNRQGLNDIHNELPIFLQERGFDVERGTGEATKQRGGNVNDVHKFKEIEHEKSILDERRARLERNESDFDKALSNVEEKYNKAVEQAQFAREAMQKAIALDNLLRKREKEIEEREKEIFEREKDLDKRYDNIHNKVLEFITNKNVVKQLFNYGYDARDKELSAKTIQQQHAQLEKTVVVESTKLVDKELKKKNKVQQSQSTSETTKNENTTTTNTTNSKYIEKESDSDLMKRVKRRFANREKQRIEEQKREVEKQEKLRELRERLGLHTPIIDKGYRKKTATNTKSNTKSNTKTNNGPEL